MEFFLLHGPFYSFSFLYVFCIIHMVVKNKTVYMYGDYDDGIIIIVVAIYHLLI